LSREGYVSLHREVGEDETDRQFWRRHAARHDDQYYGTGGILEIAKLEADVRNLEANSEKVTASPTERWPISIGEDPRSSQRSRNETKSSTPWARWSIGIVCC
jgi:hypothetical protein